MEHQYQQLLEDIKYRITQRKNLNPISDEYNHSELTSYVDELWLQYQMQMEQKTFQLFTTEIKSCFLQLNEQYEIIMKKIEDTLDFVNLNDMVLIEKCLLLTNMQFLGANEILDTDKKENSRILNLGEISSSPKRKTVFGDEIFMQDAIEMSVDTLNQAIRIIKIYNKGKLITSNNRTLEYVQILLLNCNVLHLLTELCDQYLHEFKHLILLQGKIAFIYLGNFGYLKKVGKRRYQNHIMEPSIHNGFPIISFTSTRHEVRYGTMYFSEKDISNYREYLQLNIGVLIYHKVYLNSSGFNLLNGANANEIYQTIIAIQLALKKITFNNTFDDEKSLNEIPLKIDKKTLIRYLEKITKISAKKIESIFSCLTSTISENFDGWKTPLVNYNRQYYCLLGSLENGHVGYLMDVVLSSVYRATDEITLFSKHVKGEILSKDNKYSLHIDNPISTDSSFFLLQLDTYSIAIQATIYHFPISPADYQSAFKIIGQAAEKLQNNIILLSQNAKENNKTEDLLKVIITDYPFLSGIVVNDCYIVDINLLHNYISTGEFVRGKVSLNKSIAMVGLRAQLKYYTNKKEYFEGLKDFLKNPPPITETLSQYTTDVFPVAEKFLQVKIVNYEVREATFEKVEELEINRLESILNQHYYFDTQTDQLKGAHQKKFFNSLVEFYMPYTFSIVAFDSQNRSIRVSLINSLTAIGLRGLSYTLTLVRRLTISILNKKITSTVSPKHEKTNEEVALADLKEILITLKNTKISLSTISLGNILPDERRTNLIDFLVTSFEIGLFQNNSLENLDDQFFNLTILAGLMSSKETSHDVRFIKAGLNFLDQLNSNYYYQKARNFSEEILKYYFEKGETPLLGWLFQLRCFTKQNNVPEAACYAALLLSVMDSLESIEKDVCFEIYYNLMIFHRSYHETNEMTPLFEVLKSIAPSEYDLHKVHLSYFMGTIQTTGKNLHKNIAQIKDYLSEHVNAIIAYGQYGAMPWTALVYNINKVIDKEDVGKDNFWDTILLALESELPDDVKTNMQAVFFKREETIPTFKEALLHTFETVNVEDLVYEIRNIESLAYNAIGIAINQNDINILLLAGLVINDQTLTFKLKPWQEYVQFSSEPELELKKYIDNYVAHFINDKLLQEGQCIFWIFDYRPHVYCLCIERNQNRILKIPSWSLTKMQTWRNNQENFFFPSGQDYFINQQEDDYIKTLESLQFFKIPLVENCSEILVYYSVNTAMYPHNLLVADIAKINQRNFEHEAKVDEAINRLNVDFASLYLPVTNIGSLEWFKENNTRYIIDLGKYSIELWCPAEDEDFVLNFTLEKIRPVLEAFPLKKIVTSTAPEQSLSSNFNIFIAHGEKNIEGFKTVYTKHDGGGAFVKHSGTSFLFGTGDIAIVFVCNSAFISKEVFAERMISLTNEILLLGYKAVIAPAWSLNPDIIPHWLTAFFEKMQEGASINQSVHSSNRYIAKHGHNEYNGYYAPTGWACMHLFGNPNVYMQ